MTLRALYRHPSESAKHEQIKILFEEYIVNMHKLMTNPSRLYAQRARKALITLRKVSAARCNELVLLYAPSMNQGRKIINARHGNGISTDTTSEQSQGQNQEAQATGTQQEK